jgi:serine protease AprX
MNGRDGSMHHNFTSSLQRTSVLVALGLAAATGLSAAPGATAAAPVTRVVVTSLAGDVSAAARAVQTAGGQVLDRLSLIGGVSATLPAGTHLAPSYRVLPDAVLRVAGRDDDEQDKSGRGSKAVGGVRATLGMGPAAGEGSGITVAVVDTGVADVPDLPRVTHVNVSGGPDGDGYGHGTFVAGLVAGTGAGSRGAYAGVAPGARILDVKVADAAGSTSLITVLKGLQQVAAHPEVDVVNLSLSSGSPLPYQIDPLSAALDALWRRGVTVVVPAGNDGPAAGTIASPGSDPVLLTTGGLDDNGTARHDDDTVASWSGRGPAAQGLAKPDLVAPGSHVVSLAAPGSTVLANNPGSAMAGGYLKGSGTSFSTAVTSGAVAALLARRPGLSPNQVKGLLTDTSYDAKGLKDKDAAGAGGLDLAEALDGKVKKDRKGSEADSIPGDPAVWAAFLNAILSGDAAAAASSWSKLSPAARNWAASSWSNLGWDARNWAARNWAARNWAGGGVSAEEWAARNWAARNWAARNWADSDWSASSWSARNWAASTWSARNWADDDWAARNWAAGSWSARNWAARNWG